VHRNTEEKMEAYYQSTLVWGQDVAMVRVRAAAMVRVRAAAKVRVRDGSFDI